MIRLGLEDLEQIATVSDPRISPDGSRVAYLVTRISIAENESTSAIWLVAFEGGEPKQLTVGATSEGSPAWSPDGRSLAFVSDRSGASDLYVLPLDGGEPRRVTTGAKEVREPTWSPDGRWIAYVAPGADRRGDPVPSIETDGRKRLLRVTRHRHKHDGEGFYGPARRHIWRVASDGGAVQQLTDGTADDLSPAWAPDGTLIAFISDRSPERDRHYEGGAIHVLDIVSGEIRCLTSENGRAAHPSWSPDGTAIAYVGSAHSDDASPFDVDLWSVPATGGEPRNWTSSLGRSVGMRPGGYLTPSPPAWTTDGFLYLVGTGGSTHLWRIAESMTRLTSGAHAAATFTASQDASRVAMLVSSPTMPGELFAWDQDRGLRQLTDTNEPFALAEPRRLEITRDGRTIEGWLLAPATTKPCPLILSVHGGPHNYFGHAWNFDHQLYAARGWAVLYVNPRGSGGYGESFASDVIADWGGGDFQDLMAFLDHVIESADPPIDPNRLAITGGSYGGYMTCWALTQTDRFAVGVAGACISSLVSFFGTSDLGATWGAREFGGAPHEREEFYRERSPLTHVANVKTPLLLYHGESDLRCLIEQSEQMFSALRRLGREVELLRIPGETHGALGSGSPVHRVEARRVILDWLDRYLG